MKEEFEYRLELLKQEMETAQGGIQAYNEAQFKVRALAIPLLGGLLIFAADKHQLKFLILGAIVVCLFWFQDAFFQSIQRVYVNRARDLETIVNSEEFSEAFGKQSLRNLTLSEDLIQVRKGNLIHVPYIEEGCKDWESHKFRRTRDELKSPQNLFLYIPLLFLLMFSWLMLK